MEALFSEIGREVETASDRLVATHNAVVDQVFAIPLSAMAFNAKKDAGEQRFHGDESVRLGGGGINFALAASSLGHPGAEFAGFMDRCARCMARRMRQENRLRISIHPVMSGERRNAVIELMDGNIVLQGNGRAPDPEPLIAMVGSLGISGNDWIASCSFYPEVSGPLLSLAKRFFLDSGYGYPRRNALMMSSLARGMALRSFDDFIVAANQTELGNLCSEFGVPSGDLALMARRLSMELSARSGSEVDVLLHTADFSTLMSPSSEPWAVPALEIAPRRRTNAGDTFAGAFLCAYDATGDPMLSAFFANAATAKRLADDELPTRENVSEFLRRSKLKEARDGGTLMVGRGELEALMPGRGSSVCLRASRGEEDPALRIAK